MEDGQPLLHNALQGGNLDLVSTLVLVASLDPNAVRVEEAYDWSGLCVTVQGGHYDATKALVDCGADVDLLLAVTAEDLPCCALSLAAL